MTLKSVQIFHPCKSHSTPLFLMFPLSNLSRGRGLKSNPGVTKVFFTWFRLSNFHFKLNMICGLHCAIHWAYMVKIHSTGKGKDLPREAGKWLEPTSKRVFIKNINFVQQLCLSTIARKIHSIKVPNLIALMHQTINSPPCSTCNAQ